VTDTTFRRSRTTRCPTSVIKYDETYAPIPLSTYTTRMATIVATRRSRFGSTLSKIGLIRVARYADAAA
jgi:hypothetical protein